MARMSVLIKYIEAGTAQTTKEFDGVCVQLNAQRSDMNRRFDQLSTELKQACARWKAPQLLAGRAAC